MPINLKKCIKSKKNSGSVMIKTHTLKMEGKLLILIKGIYENLYLTLHLLVKYGIISLDPQIQES